MITEYDLGERNGERVVLKSHPELGAGAVLLHIGEATYKSGDTVPKMGKAWRIVSLADLQERGGQPGRRPTVMENFLRPHKAAIRAEVEQRKAAKIQEARALKAQPPADPSLPVKPNPPRIPTPPSAIPTRPIEAAQPPRAEPPAEGARYFDRLGNYYQVQIRQGCYNAPDVYGYDVRRVYRDGEAEWLRPVGSATPERSAAEHYLEWYAHQCHLVRDVIQAESPSAVEAEPHRCGTIATTDAEG